MDEKELKEAVAELAKDKNQRAAFAEMITEWLGVNHITTDFVGMLLNARSLNPGDSLVKKVRKGLKVRTLVPGSMPLAGEITVSERINYILDGAIISATANQWELESGELGTVESIRSEMLAKLKDFYMNKVFTALSSVWTAANTPLNFTDVSGSGTGIITATALKNAIDYINETAGGVRMVVSTRHNLTPVTTFGASWDDGSSVINMVVPENVREIMSTGWLGRYYGAPLLGLTQVYDNPEDYNAMLPTDKVLVIGQNVGEFITYGDVKTQQYDDMKVVPPQWTLSLYQQFGLIVDNAKGIYVIKVLP
jgi:hypothetical protein